MSYEEDLARRARDAAAVARDAAAELVRAAVAFDCVGAPSIEVRRVVERKKSVVDEIVAKNVFVHLEQMGDHWSLILTGANGVRILVSLTSKSAVVVEDEGDVVFVTAPATPAKEKP
jgi:putative heme degradation protein